MALCGVCAGQISAVEPGCLPGRAFVAFGRGAESQDKLFHIGIDLLVIIFA